LDVVANHIAREEDGHFITANARDFMSGGRLRSELAADLAGTTRPLTLHTSTFEFVDLGRVVPGFGLDPQDIESRASATVRLVLPLANALPHAAFGRLEARSEYGARVASVELLEVRSLRRYAKGNDALTVINAIWGVVADVWRVSEGGARETRLGLRFRGSLQLYLPTRDGVDGIIQIVSGRFECLETSRLSDRAGDEDLVVP